MTSSIVVTKDEKIIDILSEYRDLFILTKHCDEAQFYADLCEKITQGDPIDIETLQFVAKVTTNKILNGSNVKLDALLKSILDAEIKQHANRFKYNATYLVGFIAVQLQIFNKP